MTLETAVNTRRFVVGTAGHVDHGKSTLVKYLTGIDPDRLREEKERALTIDLGFAWFELPGGVPVSIVDVPGHERFIKNMLAGVGGIDAAVLVVAADEGPMPQTVEHLAILDLVRIKTGIVVVTKRDLVDDEWLDLVIEETREVLDGTVLSDAPIIPVSAHTGEGVGEFVESLESLLMAIPETSPGRRPRLPVDRVFTVSGFGTVVTGTLLGGQLQVGQDIELLPSGVRSRVRGLQSHGNKVDLAYPGSRTAVNLTGIDRSNVQRGELLTTPGWLRPTRMLDAKLRLIPQAPRAMEQNDPVDFFVGAAEVPAYVTLLNAERIEPGDEGWVQIRCDEPVAVVAGDLFIVRQASPSMTMGGGTVVNPHPRRHRRFRDDVIRELETLASGTPEDRLVQAVAEGSASLQELARHLSMDLGDVRSLVRDAAGQGSVIVLGPAASDDLEPGRLVMEGDQYRKLSESLAELLDVYHRRNPLRRGMSREEIRSRLRLENRTFDALVQTLIANEVIVDHGNVLSLADHAITLSDEQQQRADRYVAALDANPNAPPSPGDYGIDQELLSAMAEQGTVVRLADNVVFSADHLARVKRETLEMIDANGEITLAQFRDHFGSSRKYAQAVLEYFDQQRVTRRVGDVRVRGSG